MKPWQIVSNFFSLPECENHLRALQASCELNAGVTHDGEDLKMRRSRTGWPCTKQNHELFTHLSHVVHLLNMRHFKLQLGKRIEWQLTHYTHENSGVYHSHMDSNLNTPFEKEIRKVSMTLQLSRPGEYLGGDFHFTAAGRPDAALARQVGSLLVFPSFVVHEVTPVTQGERWSLVAWFSGPHFS